MHSLELCSVYFKMTRAIPQETIPESTSPLLVTTWGSFLLVQFNIIFSFATGMILIAISYFWNTATISWALHKYNLWGCSLTQQFLEEIEIGRKFKDIGTVVLEQQPVQDWFLPSVTHRNGKLTLHSCLPSTAFSFSNPSHCFSHDSSSSATTLCQPFILPGSTS